MGAIAPLIVQVRTLWGRLSQTQRLALIGVGGGALVFAFIFLRMGGGGPTDYVTAFTNLDPKDANAASEELKAQGIPFKLEGGGSTITVPAERATDAKLKLSAKGLPQGGQVGFELFDKTSFGVTDFVQHLNYQRALEGELSRTINTLGQVEGSRVHIVVPKQELFSSQQKPATASVVLRMRTGRPMDDNSLKGIAYMVARSVEGLEDKNITILDSSGRMLYDGGSASGGIGLSASQLDLQKRVEKDVETDVQSLLDRVAGANRAAVRVKADLDFSQQESLNKTFTPGGAQGQGVPRSQSSVQEKFNGGANGGTQPGAAANVPPTRPNAASAGANSAYERSETTTNFEVSENTQKTTKGPGSIKRLSVSVLLDSSIPEADAAGLRDAISAAAGIDQQRGDQIVVTTAAFNSDGNVEAIPVAPGGPMDLLARYGKLVAPLLAAVLVLLVVWRMSRSVSPKRPRARVIEPSLAPGTPISAIGGNSTREWVSAPEGSSALGNPATEFQLPQPVQHSPEEQRRRNEIQDRMVVLAKNNPDAIGEIIHGWMFQDEKGR